MKIQPAVQRRDAWSCLTAEKRKVQIVAVKVNDVKRRRLTKNLIHQSDMMR